MNIIPIRTKAIGLLRISLVVALVIIINSCRAGALPSGTYGSGAYGSCEYGEACSISITSNGSISLNVTPSASGSCTIQSDTATVTTDDTNGYTLLLANTSNNTALVNGPATIDTTTGTISSPATLAGNNWGYRIDGLGGFGSGPTSSQLNSSRGSILFAGIKASNQLADTIATNSGAANPAISTTAWFGVCADTTVPSGDYTAQVLYTAVAN